MKENGKLVPVETKAAEVKENTSENIACFYMSTKNKFQKSSTLPSSSEF